MRSQTKFPQEWKLLIQKNNIKHRFICDILQIDFRKFENMLYGLIYIPDDLYKKIKLFIESIEDGTLQKVNKEYKPRNNIFKIICKICDRPFEPYGGDLLPICKQCLIMKDHIRKERNRLGLYWEDE